MRAVATSSRSRRIVLVAGEFLGYPKVGGLGTATTFLAIGLARAGHDVEILCARRGTDHPVDPTWRDIYDAKGIAVRLLEPTAGVEPQVLALPAAVLAALRVDPPDVAIVQDWGGNAYAALTMRELGLAFPETLFVIYAHGTRRWILEAHGKLPDSLDSVAMSAIERSAVEGADVVVSPSGYMLEWMRGQAWTLPDAALTIPLITEAAAMNTAGAEPRGEVAPISRLVFFGRLEDRKGIKPFLHAVSGLHRERLRRLELVFLGQATPRWTPDRINAELLPEVRASLRGVEFRTTLARGEALAELRRPGTIAVIPSLDENSPNTVYECLEAGVPFLASAVGGIPELVAESDRSRVLFDPSAHGIREAIERTLDTDPPFAAVRPAFDAAEAVRAWERVVQRRPPVPFVEPDPAPLVTAVVAARIRDAAVSRCVEALARQRYEPLEIVLVSEPTTAQPDGDRVRVVEAPDGCDADLWIAGAREAAGEWVLLVGGHETPHDDLVGVLVRAQAASSADAVTCGIASAAGANAVKSLFLGGRAGGLGLLENAFGTVGLVRRSLIDAAARGLGSGDDPAWPFYARLVASGARVVSVPETLVTAPFRRGQLRERSSDALAVLRAYEAALPPDLRSLASTSVAAALPRDAVARPGLRQRARYVWRHEGPIGILRRAARQVRAGSRGAP